MDARPISVFLRSGPSRLALDVLGCITVLAAYGHAVDPDLAFHFLFVLLTVHAFAFGLRSGIVRIGAAAALICLDMAFPGGMTLDELATEFIVLFLIAGTVVVLAQRQQQTARQYAAMYREASDQLLGAQEAERRRLALELHDGIGQTLTALSLTLESVAEATPGSPRQLHQLGRARAVIRTALDEAHGLAEELRPSRLQEMGLTAAVWELAGHAGIPVEVEIDPELGPLKDLPGDVAVDVYRIVQEALSNAARHGAPGARVALKERRGGLHVTVADRGPGFDPEAATAVGLGIVGMRERAAAIRASLSIRSSVGRGTVVGLTVPRIAGRSSEWGSNQLAKRGATR